MAGPRRVSLQPAKSKKLAWTGRRMAAMLAEAVVMQPLPIAPHKHGNSVISVLSPLTL